MEQEQYKVHLESFEGPLDLLLHLIEKNRIDIYDIPIALLTEQYMEYLGRFKQFNIEIASEFLVMAATLLQIKSRILLPDAQPQEAAEDEEDIDPRRELVERLLEYRRYKEVSQIMRELAEEAGRRYFRAGTLPPPKHLPPGNMSVELLFRAFQDIAMAQAEKEEPLVANVEREQFTIEDKIAFLLELLHQKKGSICFNTEFCHTMHRQELITTFLALLELIKLKRVTVYQTGIFSPIYLKLNNECDNEAAADASVLKIQAE